MKVLFVCTRNTCRSVLAEYLGRRFCGDVFTFESAGIRPQRAADAENAVHILKNTFAIDASGHQPRDVLEVDLTRFDLVIAIENKAAAVVRELGVPDSRLHVWAIRDPWETLLLLANGIKPTRAGSGKRVSNRKALAQIDLHWHDLRHEALSRLADDGVPVHELQLLAGHSSITTTQRYMNARASSLAESMRQARERRVNRVEQVDEATAQIG